MIRTTFTPLKTTHFRPAFWGIDRDFKDVVDQLENVWTGNQTTQYQLKETEKAFLVSIDMPGVSKDNLEIQTDDKMIHITGTRKNLFNTSEDEREKATEDVARKISHSVRLPELVAADKIQARIEDGVLYLALPKVEKAQPKKIVVEDSVDEKSWGHLLE